MWQRYNVTSKIFEKSVDNGANWTPLGLNASIITEGNLAPARQWISTAYTDNTNIFAVRQEINDHLILRDNTQAVDARVWRILNSAGNFYVQSTTDNIGAMQGAVQFTRTGNIIANGITLAGSGYDSLMGAWTTYTPSFTADGAAPTIGNGTLIGKYTQINKLIFFVAHISAGTTTNFGSGNLHLSIPKDNLAAYIGPPFPQFFGRLYNPATGQSLTVTAVVASPNLFTMYEANNGYPITSTNPFTLGSGVDITITGFYETL